MTKETKSAMRKIRLRLTRLIGMEVSACGFDDNLLAAAHFRVDLERIIAFELEHRDRRISALLSGGGNNP
jgi:hypothetical protein